MVEPRENRDPGPYGSHDPVEVHETRRAENTPKKILDGINFILGLWLIIAPWALKTSLNPTSTWTAVVIGILVVIVSAWGMAQNFNKTTEWINVMLGALFFISPWVFGFASIPAAWNAWIIGAAIAVIAMIAIPLAGRYYGTRRTVRG